MNKVVIVSATRTPLAQMLGAYSQLSATDLGSFVLQETLRKTQIAPSCIDEVILGNVLPHGLGQNPARQACLKADFPFSVTATTVNKVCGSGLRSVMFAAQSIACGHADSMIAGGMESMSHAPYLVEKLRTGYRLGDATFRDAMIVDGLWDCNNNLHMGSTAELIAKKYNVSREEMDEFAFRSYEKAIQAEAKGLFDKERMTLTLSDKKKGHFSFSTDEIVRPTSLESLAALRPAFEKAGSVTAGNSSKISDGAAAVLVCSEEFANKHSLPVLAEIVSFHSVGIDPLDVLVAPMVGIPKLLQRSNLELQDIDLFEINEAFAASSVAIQKNLHIPEEKINVLGGSIALGHPIGASGTRVLVTLLTALKSRNAKRGLVSLCLGGGEAVSMIVERT